MALDTLGQDAFGARGSHGAGDATSLRCSPRAPKSSDRRVIRSSAPILRSSPLPPLGRSGKLARGIHGHITALTSTFVKSKAPVGLPIVDVGLTPPADE